jgi:hypothetical protein
VCFHGVLSFEKHGLIIQGPFTNVRSNLYWTDTEDALNPDRALTFGTRDGGQGPFIKYGLDGSRLWTWAITPGLVSAVPVPSAIWLFGSGLLGLIGLKRSNKTT